MPDTTYDSERVHVGYGNTVWYLAANDKATVGFINDHFLDTPDTAAYPQFQTPHCASAGSGPHGRRVVLRVCTAPIHNIAKVPTHPIDHTAEHR